MLCRSGIDIGFGDIQDFDVPVESIDVFLGIIVQIYSLSVGPLYSFIIDISDVHHMDHFITHELEESFQKILKNIGTEIPDVRKIIDRRAASVKFDHPGFDRAKGFDSAAEGVEELDHQSLL